MGSYCSPLASTDLRDGGGLPQCHRVVAKVLNFHAGKRRGSSLLLGEFGSPGPHIVSTDTTVAVGTHQSLMGGLGWFIRAWQGRKSRLLVTPWKGWVWGCRFLVFVCVAEKEQLLSKSFLSC